MGLMNLRNALMSGKRTPTARDYVQPGLVAMWDGIENAGWGVHDQNATTWKDLVGNHDFTLTNLGSFGIDSFINSSGGIGASQPMLSLPYQDHQFEIVFTTASYNHYENYYTVYLSPGDGRSNGPAAIGKRYEGIISGWPSFYRSWNTNRTVGKRAFSFANAVAPMYVNGAAQSANFITQNLGTAPSVAAISAGTRNISIFTMRLYSRALTASEIAANYAIDKTRFNLPAA